MTGHPSTLAEPTASFLDALSGADGTAAPAMPVEIPPSYADATADQFRGQEITVHAPRLPEVRIEAPAVEDWFDADLLSGVAAARSGLPGGGAGSASGGGAGTAGGSDARAEAARRAAAARRDAAVASRLATSQGRPGLAPPPPPGHAPSRVASTGRGQMPITYMDPYAHPAPPPAAGRRPASVHAGYAPPTRQRFAPPAPAAQGRPAGAPVGKTSYPFEHRPRRKRGGGWAALLAVIIFLLISGTGRELLDVITGLLNR